MATQPRWPDPLDTAEGESTNHVTFPAPQTLRCPKGHETTGSAGIGGLATVSMQFDLSSGEKINTGQRCMACLAILLMEHVPLMELVK